MILIPLLLSFASPRALPPTGSLRASSPQTPVSERPRGPESARAQAPPEALLPGTWMRVRIDVAGFRPSNLDSAVIRRRYADRALLVGKLEPGDTMLALTRVEPERRGEAAALRDELLRADPRGGESFSVGDVPCLERVHELEEGLEEARWDAFLVLYSGSVLQLSCSTVLTGTGPRFTRASFEAVLAGVHAAWLRRGRFEDYPPSLLAVFDELCLGGARSRRSIEGARVAAAAAREGREPALPPASWEQAFALGELCAPDDAARRTYFELARGLLEQRAELDARETLVLAMCEESLGILALRAADPRAGVGHFLKAAGLAEKAREEFRAGIGYNQACAHALCGEGEAALAALEKAIALEPRYRDLAREDADFAGLRADPRYQELVARAK